MTVKSWDQELSHEESIPLLRRLALAHCALVGQEQKTNPLIGFIDRCDWRAVCDWEPSYVGANVSDLMHLVQAQAFFKKLENLDLGIDQEAAAWEKFQSAERKCRETNSLFEQWALGEFNFSPSVERILFDAQRKIAAVLGDLPALNELRFTFGAGATTTVPKRKACSRIKLSTVPSCSSSAIHILPSFFREVPQWSALHATNYSVDNEGWLIETVAVQVIVPRLSFVPKNAKTKRVVRPEPTVDGMIQRGYGEVIADRLLSVGQDIHDQERYKLLARVGSLTGDLATLDLSSASDLLARGLIHHLLPYDWYSALDTCRAKSYEYNGSEFLLHGYSGMGNGFTFPLQTLIFWSLVTSAVAVATERKFGKRQKHNPRDVSVYGDDIICPSYAVGLVREVFDAVGFSLNMEKSFWEGPFRESCGGDYLLGIDIRPYFQKKNISGRTLLLCTIGTCGACNRNLLLVC